MPFVDRIIQYMQSEAGERIVLVNDGECRLYRAGGTAAPVPHALSLAQINSLLTEIMPEEQRALFAAGETFHFPYRSPAGLLDVEGWLNGERKQASNTRQLIFPVPQIVAFVSHVMTLLPGDVIATGTPSGVGLVKRGDTFMVRISGIGELSNTVNG